MTMTAADAEKKVIAAFKKAGIEQTRIKSDETHVEVVGLGVEAIHVSVPLEGLTAEKLTAAIEEALPDDSTDDADSPDDAEQPASKPAPNNPSVSGVQYTGRGTGKERKG